MEQPQPFSSPQIHIDNYADFKETLPQQQIDSSSSHVETGASIMNQTNAHGHGHGPLITNNNTNTVEKEIVFETLVHADASHLRSLPSIATSTIDESIELTTETAVTAASADTTYLTTVPPLQAMLTEQNSTVGTTETPASSNAAAISISSQTRTAAAMTTSGSAASTKTTKLSQSRDENWERMFHVLVQYKDDQGHCLVPKSFPENKSLSHWVYRQRSLYMTRHRKNVENKTLSDERIARLHDLGFVFHARSTKEQSQVESQRRKPASDANWMKNFELLSEFKEKMGHTLVPKVYKTNQTFSSW